MIYLDHNATTPLAPEVKNTLSQLLDRPLGNPSSWHHLGQESASLIQKARSQVADALGCSSSEILFSSSGTESNLSALRGVLRASSKKHLIISAVEHPSILLGAKQLEKEGYSVSYLPVDSQGALDLSVLEQTISSETALVSIMMANNETGILFPISEIAKICQQKKVLLHSDAVQALGKIPVSVKTLGVDLLSFSAHKIYGPTGCGVLYFRKNIPFKPLIPGHQESERRGGTENVFGIVGTGIACTLLPQRLQEMEKIKILRDSFEEKCLQIGLPIRIHGQKQPRVANTSNLSFQGTESQRVLLLLNRQHIFCSSGSACTAGSEAPSHVLSAMKIPLSEIRGTLRISLGKDTLPSQIDQLLTVLQESVLKIKSSS